MYTKKPAPIITSENKTIENGYETECLYTSSAIREIIVPSHKPSAANNFSRNVIMVNKPNKNAAVKPRGVIRNESRSKEKIRIKMHEAIFFLVRKRTTEYKNINGKEIMVDSKKRKTRNIGIETKTDFIDYFVSTNTVVSFLKSRRLSTTAD